MKKSINLGNPPNFSTKGNNFEIVDFFSAVLSLVTINGGELTKQSNHHDNSFHNQTTIINLVSIRIFYFYPE